MPALEKKWLINETTVETIVSPRNNFSKPKDYVQIGIDAEDYYRIKDAKND